MQMAHWFSAKIFYMCISIYVYIHTVIDITNELEKEGICYIFQNAK